MLLCYKGLNRNMNTDAGYLSLIIQTDANKTLVIKALYLSQQKD
jgi:hypothetical protein